MPRHKITNTFMKGMNKDKTWTKADPDSYRESSNLRPITDDMGDSSGSLSTVRGNAFNYELPDLPKSYLWRLKDDSSIADLTNIPVQINGVSNLVPIDVSTPDEAYKIIAEHINSTAYPGSVVAQYYEFGIALYSSNQTEMDPAPTSTEFNTSVLGSDLDSQVIIGETTIRDVSILFTTNFSASSSAIWKVTWDEQDKPTLTLVRHSDDNFSTYHDIEAVGRYELNTIQRVYWTDFNNDLRSINIESPSSFLDNIDIIQDIKYTIPYVEKINQEGGELKVGWYSYAYRQKILSGTETAFSAWSAPFPIQEANEDELKTRYIEYVGSKENTSTTKSLNVEIPDLDKSYTHIDVIGMYQKDLSSAGVYFYVVKEVELTGTDNFNFTHANIEETDFISEEEIYIPNTIFTKCKTLAIKDNRLLVGNVKDSATVLNNYDTRAYRYPEYIGTIPSYASTVDETNPYNKDSTKVSNNKYEQHQYQKNSNVLGGTGSNISYSFIQKGFMLDQYGDISQPTISSEGRHKVGGVGAYIDTATVNNKTVQMGGYWDCFKNPFFASHFRGYMRSEVYRFGIVFFDKSGRTLEVDWIDDIRMPEQSEDFPAFNKPWDSYTRGYSLGVNFSVTVPESIKKVVSGFSIVRAERKPKDENVRAQGMITDLSEIILTHRDDVDPRGPDKADEWGRYLFRNIRQGFFGEVSGYDDGQVHKICAPLTCIHVPRMLLKNQGFDFTGYKIRPVSAVEVTGRNVFDSSNSAVPVDSWGAGGKDKWRWSKYFDVSDYYADNNDTDCYSQLTNQIENHQICFGQSAFGPPNLFEDTSILGGLPGSYERWRSILNYAWPHNPPSLLDYARLVNSAFSGNNQLLMRGRGGSTCHIVRIDPTTHRKLYFSSPGTGTESTNANSRIGPSTLWQSSEGSDFHLGNLIGGSSGAQWWKGDATRRVIFNLYRETQQYGGSTKNDILATEYISTGHYQPVSSTDGISTYECRVFGGDVYVSVWSENTIAAHNHTGGFAVYDDYFSSSANGDEAYGDGSMFVVESKINLEWRQKRSINNVDVAGTPGENDPGSESKNFINWTDDLDHLLDPNDIDANWQHRQHNHKTYLSLGSFRNETDEWDNRIWASENKINGEALDSWSMFKINNLIDVDGNLGPINKLETFNNEVFYFQDRAFGRVVVNPTPMISGSDGVTMSLGSGKVLHDFNYVSTAIGTKHQWSVFSTPSSMYWFDILNKKPYRFSGRGAEELSDVSGMHSFFLNNVDNILIDTDNPARSKGIRGTYDFLNNEALFTFLNSKTSYSDSYSDYTTYGPSLGGIGGLIPEGSLVRYSGSRDVLDDEGNVIASVGYQRAFDVIKEYPISSAYPGGPPTLVPPVYRTNEYLRERPSYLGLTFTLGYSELMNAWSTFYDFAPTIYINTKSRLLTPNSDYDKRVHLHNVGTYNKFYGTIYDSILEVITNQAPDQTKVYDNVTWHTNARTDDGAGGQTLDQVTFDEYYCYNDYQHSGLISLDPTNKDIRRVEREWQTFIPRNVVVETGTDVDVLNSTNWNLSRQYSDRIRDKYLIQHFRYDASKSDQFIINYINTYVRTSNR